MSVNRISQSHAREAEAVQNVSSQKPQNTATKANALHGQESQVHGEPAAQVRPPTTMRVASRVTNKTRETIRTGLV